jgi:oligosaccharide repeat unit polymerase
MRIKKGYIYSALWCAVCGLLLVLSFDANQRIWVTICFSVLGIALARTVYRDGMVSATMFYGLLYGLFHFTTPISIFLLGLVEPMRESGFLYSDIVVDASVLSLFGLAAFQMGAELGAIKKVGNSVVSRVIGTSKERSIFRLSLALFILFCTAYFTVGIQSGLLIGGKELLIEMRKSGGGESHLFGITGQLLTIVAFITVAFAPRKYILFLAGIAVAMYLPMFLSGKRGSFIVMLAAMAIVVSKRGVKISSFYIGAGIPAVLFAMSYMRRVVKGAPDFASAWYLNALYEMGQQLQVVMHTIDAINNNITEFWFGASYLWGLWRVIPNIGGIRGIFREADPGIWITENYGGEVGLGYSAVAEPYLNFGWLGVFFVMGGIGFALSWSERVTMESRYVLAIYGASLGGIFFAIRGDMSGVFRTIVWTWLILKMLRVIVRSYRGIPISLAPESSQEQPDISSSLPNKVGQ